MTSLRSPWNSYRQGALHTAAPGQLVLMLFEGAIRFLERAEGGFGNAYRHGRINIVPLSFEESVLADIRQYEQVAGFRSQAAAVPLFWYADARTGIDAGGDLYLHLFVLWRHAFTMT